MAEKIDLNSILADYENMMREEDPKVKAELRYEVSQKVRKTILDTKDPEEVNKIVDQLREKMAAVNNSNKENVAADAKEELLGKILNSDRAKHDRSINRIAFEYFWMKNSEQTPSGVRAFPTVVQAKFFKKAVEEELGKLKPEERQNFIEELNKYVEAIENAQESGVGKTTSNNPFDKIHEQLKKDGAGQPKGSGDGQMGEE